MFEFSDAWFLTTLICLNKWSTMKEIIAVGDNINHAIFNPDEIESALEKLIPLGYIEIEKRNNVASEILCEIDLNEWVAIFNETNGIDAFEKLIPSDADKLLYRATEKAHELANCSAYKRAGGFTQVEVILKRLNK